MDFVQARNRMVDGQVRTADVNDLRILAALLELPRERFVPAAQAELAYGDFEILLTPASANGSARRLMRPRNLAKLIQSADLQPDDIVLVVGCATGYGAAIVARLANQVVALEEESGLAALTSEACRACGLRNVAVASGPLKDGWPARAPYDVIMVEGAIEVLPRPLCDQLADGGRLVCVEGRGLSGRAMVYRRDGGTTSGRSVFDSAAPALPGFAPPPAFVF
jgi:protein-L-isoaspartate(D-aspartate) O-methyltransferase